MKGSAITGPVGKEAAELWPVSSSPRASRSLAAPNHVAAYCQQLRCRDVRVVSGRSTNKGQAARGDVESRAMTIRSSGAGEKFTENGHKRAWLELAGFAFRLRRDMGFIPNA